MKRRRPSPCTHKAALSELDLPARNLGNCPQVSLSECAARSCQNRACDRDRLDSRRGDACPLRHTPSPRRNATLQCASLCSTASAPAASRSPKFSLRPASVESTRRPYPPTFPLPSQTMPQPCKSRHGVFLPPHPPPPRLPPRHAHP